MYNQIHQEQIAAGETTENIAEIPVVQEQVIVQTIPKVVESLPPVEEFTEPVYNQVHQEQIVAGEMTLNIVEKSHCAKTGDRSEKFRASGYGADTRTHCGHCQFGEPALRFLRHRSLVLFLPSKSLMRLRTTKPITNRPSQGRRPRT